MFRAGRIHDTKLSVKTTLKELTYVLAPSILYVQHVHILKLNGRKKEEKIYR